MGAHVSHEATVQSVATDVLTVAPSGSTSRPRQDKEDERLKTVVSAFVQEPTTEPWGNRSVLCRDPDGNLINVFTPVGADAIKKFSA